MQEKGALDSSLVAITHDDEDPASLDDFLSELATYVSNAAAMERFEQVRDKLESLSQCYADFDCKTCAGPPLKICGGDNLKDNDRVANLGYCIADIRSLFDLMETWSTGLYRRYAGDLFPTSPPTCQLGTREMTSDRRGIGDNPVISGATRSVKIGTKTGMRIWLSCDVESVTWPHLLVLPYVFAHEFICHGYQGRFTIDGRAESASAYCAWTEGWMDSLCHTLVKRALSGAPESADISFPAWLLQNAGAAKTEITKVHGRRYPGPGKTAQRSRRSSSLAAARDRFQILMRTLALVEQSMDKGIEKMTILSLKLNALKLPLSERGRIVIALGEADLDGEKERAIDIVKRVNRFINSDDPEHLLNIGQI